VDLVPRYRGASHRFAFRVAIIAGVVLVVAARPGARLPVAIYAALLAAMFGVSSLLHRGGWAPRVQVWLRRADHATIFLCIAGTYVPMSLLGLGGDAGTKLLVLAIVANGLGVARALLWSRAPRVVVSACYVAAGWVAVAYLPELRDALDPWAFALLVGGGVMFTAGALVYLLRWPDPWPRTFGYHEVFHAFTIAGAACHFAAVATLAW
jgi:hemolysin III